MANPKLSMPAAASDMFDVSKDAETGQLKMALRPDWASFFASLAQVAQNVTQTGSTSARPTSSTIGRFEGQPFLDRSLVPPRPVFLLHATSSVWIDATGTIV